MRNTANSFSQQMNVADETIISTWGLDKSDQKKIASFDDVKKVEFGYFQDSEIAGSSRSLRLYSKSREISRYAIDEGRLPRKDDEIALDYSQKGKYSLEDKISFNKEKEGKTLKRYEFSIVGFVKSSENVVATDLGASTTGTGSLNGYGVVTPENFDSKLYTIARITFKDTLGMDKVSTAYKDKLRKHEERIKTELNQQAQSRLLETKKTEQKKIDDGKKKIQDAQNELTNAKSKLSKASAEISNGKKEISDNQKKLNSSISQGEAELLSGAQQISDAHQEIKNAEYELDEAKKQLAEGEKDLQSNWGKLSLAKQELSTGKEKLNESQEELLQAKKSIQDGEVELATAKERLAGASEELIEKQKEINRNQTDITSKRNTLDESQTQLTTNQNELASQLNRLESANSDFLNNIQNLNSDLSNNQVSLNEVQNDLANIKAAIINLGQQLENAEAEQNQAEIERLKIEIQTKREEQKSKELQEVNLQQTIVGIREKISVAESEHRAFLEATYNPSIAVIKEKQAEMAILQEQLNQSNQELAAHQASLDNAQKAINVGKEELVRQQKTMIQNEKMLSEKMKEYQSGLAQYNEGIKSYNENLNNYYDGLSEWTTGFETLKAGSAEYQTNLDKYNQGKQELLEKENELAKGKETLLQEKKKNQKELDDAKIALNNGEKEYLDNLAEYSKQEKKALKEISDNQNKLDKSQKDLHNLEAPVYSVKSHEEMDSGYKSFVDSAGRIDILANIFPVFLFAVAALVSLTTMTRFVDEERLTIGIYKALGYSNSAIKKRFIIYGLASSILGTIFGSILGHTLLPKVIYAVYAAGTSLPGAKLDFYPGYTVIGLTIAIFCTVVSTYFVISKDLREKPATLLLPKPPKEGSRILLERLSPIWKRLSFNHKITARNLFRYKKRMLMTIFGVAGCMALLITAFGIKDSISGITERQSQQILKYDLLVSKEKNLNDKQQKSIDTLLINKNVESSKNIFYEELTSTSASDQSTQSITSIVTDNPLNLDKFISLKDSTNSKSLNLSDKGIVISKKLADIMDVVIGQRIILKNEKNQTFNATISGITEMYLGHFIFMNSKSYQNIFGNIYQSNGYLVNLKDSSTRLKKQMAALFMKDAGINGVVQSSSSDSESIEGLTQITLIFVFGASLLALVVIYTLSNINVSERIRELSTIKVLGFYDNEVTMYIYRETLLLSMIGILVGSVGGKKLSEFITTILPTDEVIFDSAVKWTNYGTSALITMGITLVLMVFVHNKIKKIEMLDALKSVD